MKLIAGFVSFPAHAPRLLLASLLLATSSLLYAAEPAPAAASLDGVTVQDDEGRVVSLVAPAARIVSLAPHATELVYEVGAGSQLVAVSEASDYPEAALQLPHVGGAAGLDLERIVALHPDLVIAWSSGNSQTQVEALRRAGLMVFESDPHSVEQIATTLQRLGILTGHQQLGLDRAQALRRDIAALARDARTKPKVRVFYEVWDRPLFTLGGPHLVSQLIKLCGGQNIFQDLETLAPQVSLEAVLARTPELIVTDPDQVSTLRAAWVARGLSDAERADHVVGIKADWLTRASSRIVLGTRALCSAIEERRLSH